MPWCPKCKTEYREGFSVCADCGSELVEKLAEEAAEDSEELLDLRMGDSLDEEFRGDMGQADQGEAQGEDVPTIGEGVRRERISGLYQDSSEKASDNRSSAWVLLGLGAVGLIAVILGVAGILPFQLGNPYLFYGVMGAIFILFLVAGIVSMKNARFFEKKAESENSLRQTLLDWCRDNLNAADIDAEICGEGVSDEVAYFRRSFCIKEKLNHQFVNLNQGFLDQFIDDYIYDEIFGKRAE